MATQMSSGNTNVGAWLMLARSPVPDGNRPNRLKGIKRRIFQIVTHVRVLNHYLHSKFLVLGAFEFLLLMLALHFGMYLRNFSGAYEVILQLPWAQTLVFALVMSICSLAMGVYSSIYREGMTGMVLRTLVSYFFLGTAALTILYYLIPSLFLGRGVLAFAVTSSLLFVLVARLLFFKIVDAAQLTRNVVVLGAGETASNILSRIGAFQDGLSFNLMGCIASGDGEVRVDAGNVLKINGSLSDFTKEHNVSEIVVAVDERRKSEGGFIPVDDLLDCKLRGVRISEPLSFIERELLKLEVSMLRPGWAVYSSGFSFSQSRDLIKRAFDLCLASLLLVLVWPLMLFTALAIFMESGRPIIYSQIRVGLNGKEFLIYKFRSMSQDAEKGGKAVWAQKNDSRVTRVGAFIRNTRLDELPQLYNVLKGDMSFVGPRPERPEFVSDLKEKIPFYDTRHRVKPGLMGWAQLKYPYGASVEDARNKLKYDLYYVKNHSFFLDMLIVVQTVEVVLLGKGVH